MKYSVGQKVKIHSLEWYRDNVNRYGIIECGKYEFFEPMNEYCGKVVTIKKIDDDNYRIDADKGAFCWTDEMIEGLAEEETQSKFKVGDKITNGKTHFTILQIISDKYIVEDSFGECGTLYFNTQDYWKLMGDLFDNEMQELQRTCDEIMDIQGIEPIEAEIEQVIHCPDGYIFKDENGNVINATKIVLEKKKKEYPKTYEECCYVTGFENTEMVFEDDYRDINPPKEQWKRLELINQLNKLLICRDAYWKLYGDEMGLGKPWEPDWENDGQVKYVIICRRNCVIKDTFTAKNVILAFPTEEMRGAFKENFDTDIEICKELL